jgi:multidrug efflux system membrane fusion protein
VQALYTATISPRVDGRIMQVNFTEGQMVQSNDLLVVIDPAPYQAVLTQASGQLERDKALLEEANVDLKRYQAAFEKRAVPKQQVDDQVALVHQDEGTVRFDQGQVDAAQVNVDYCYVRAPFAGRVGLRLVDPGNVVHAAETNAMVMVTQVQPITLVFNVAEDYLPQIQQQLQPENQTTESQATISSVEDAPVAQTQQPSAATRQLTVEAWDRDDQNKIATGKLLALNNLIDSATGTIRIKAIYDNADQSLFPNQFVNAKLIIQTLHNQNLVPTFAIQHNTDGSFLYVLTNTTATNNGVVTNYPTVTMRPVTTGTSDGSVTAITQGLEAGETFAMDNFNKLGDGVRVAPRQAENGGGAAAGAKKHHHKKPSPEADNSQ